MKTHKIFAILTSALIFGACNFSEEKTSETKQIDGTYRIEMVLNDSVNLPFILNFTKHNSKPVAELINGDENIRIEELYQNADSLHLTLPVFGSKLAFNILDSNTLSGDFTSPNRAEDYKIKLIGKKAKNRFEGNSEAIDAQYKVTFGNDSSDLAIGLFNTKNGVVSASFATETGDYRFIAGVVQNNKLMMSCFDGAHAFYFNADVKGDSLVNGNFYSGNHYQTTWNAVKNSEFELTAANNLTSPLEANATINKEINGVSIPSKTAKITAVQILGTWCPNCMDETKYYVNELYPEYKNKGLEIIALAFEQNGTDSLKNARIERFKRDLGVMYPVTIAGTASKTEASEMFPMLSKIISFPSTIFLNEKGEILRVHTGFYGPGTGKYYSDYKTETKAFLDTYL